MFDTLKTRFSSEELTPGVRILATLIAIINLPGFVAAVAMCFFIVPIPGIFFYLYTLMIASGKARRHTAVIVAAAGVIYDAVLLGLFLSNGGFLYGGVEPGEIMAATGLLATIGFGSMMIRILLEKEKEARTRSVVQVYEEAVEAQEPELALA